MLLYALLSINAAALQIDSLNYNSGDTFVARSDGDLIFSQASILDNQGNQVKVGLLSYKIENTSYLYFDIPLWMKGNYTLKYQDNNLLFEVLEGEALTIRPIVLYIEQGVDNARIDLFNKYSQEITAEASSDNTDIIFSRAALTIPVASTRSLYLSFDPNKIADATITLKYDSGKRSYNIPLIIAKEKPANESVSLVSQPAQALQQNEGRLLLVENISIIQHKVPRAKMINGSLHFVSGKELKNVQFHLTHGIAEIITLNATGYDVMLPNQEYEAYLWINKYKNFPAGEYSGILSLDSENGDTANVSFLIELTEISLPQKEPKLNITRTSFNATDVKEVNFTFVNYTEEAQKEKEKREKNLRLGLILAGIFFLIAAIFVYVLRPKPKELKFEEYVSQFKKGASKKKP